MKQSAHHTRSLKYGLFVVVAIMLTCCIAACVDSSTTAPPALPQGEQTFTQNGLISSLLDGNYNGTATLGTLIQSNTTCGLGTVDHLDGELIILDGIAYQIRLDGTVHVVSPGETTPFAQAAPFSDPTRLLTRTTSNTTLTGDDLATLIATNNEHPAQFKLIRIEGTFETLNARSVPRQEPPYIPLSEVVKNQSVFPFKDVTGTIIGVWSPAWTGAGLSVPGEHLHFLSADHKTGGHVLNFTLTTGTIDLQEYPEFSLIVSSAAGGDAVDQEAFAATIAAIEK